MSGIKPLQGAVAVVAGARGAGRGIACMLGEAGAQPFIAPAASVQGQLSIKGQPETANDTARMVTERGGTGIAVRVDHTIDDSLTKSGNV